MGLQIIIKGANFSANNVGKIDPPLPLDPDAGVFIAAANVTNPIHADAINVFVTNLKSSGLWAKHDHLDIFYGSTVSQQSVRLKGSVPLVWINDSPSAHTTKGYVTLASALRCVSLGVAAPETISNWWFGFHNSTPELVLPSANMTYTNITFLARKGPYTQGKMVSTAGNTTYNLDKTGLLIAARNGASSLKLYDEGVQIAENTSTITATGQPTLSAVLGAFRPAAAPETTLHSSATYTYAGSGLVAFTGTDALVLSQQLATLNAALGR